jgi:signal transduction histidine kinase
MLTIIPAETNVDQLSVEVLKAQTTRLLAIEKETGMSIEELAAQYDRLNHVLNHLPGGIAMGDTGLTYRWLNESYADIYSKVPSEFLNRNIFQVFPGAEPFLEGPLKLVVEKGEDFKGFGMPLPYVVDGVTTIKYFDFMYTALKNKLGEIEGILAHGFDVTPRVLLEQEVEKQTQLLLRAQNDVKTAQKAAKIGSWYYDKATKNLVFSDELKIILGITPDEPITTKLISDRLSSGEFIQFKAILKGAPLDGPLEHTWLKTIKTTDDKPNLERIQLSTHWEQQEDRFIGLTQDITIQKKAERILLERQERLLEIDELKNNFISSVSHELRTPLTTILGYSEFLEDNIEGSLNQAQKHQVNQIQQAAVKLLKLVDDLLDFSKIESGTFRIDKRLTSVGPTVLESVNSLKVLARQKQVELLFVPPQKDYWVWLDTFRINQVIVNVVNNALRFTPPKGIITVSITEEPSALKITITDNGEGIAPEPLKRIFERFYQVQATGQTRPSSGTGLGLSIVKALVEAHEGQVGVESTLGVGTSFWFTLPR